MFADKIINKNVTATSTNKEINAPPIPTVSFAKRTGIIYEDKNGIYEVIRITILFGSEAPSINQACIRLEIDKSLAKLLFAVSSALLTKEPHKAAKTEKSKCQRS